MDAVQSVRVSERQMHAGLVPRITVVIGDLHLHCDVLTDREIRLAARLAKDHGASFQSDMAMAARVEAAIAKATGEAA